MYKWEHEDIIDSYTAKMSTPQDATSKKLGEVIVERDFIVD